jgi:MFS transporter, PPP family, 3-phenylpropionic acid transporter
MAADEGRGFAIRSGLFGAVIFVGVGIYIPFFPLWLAERGFSGPEIGIILAAPLFARIPLMPLLTGAAERLPNLGLASALYGFAAGLLLALLIPASGFWPILLLWSGAYLLWNVLPALLDAIILVGVRQHGIDYARVRLWASVGFVAASLTAAVVADRTSGDVVFLLLVASFFAGGVVALWLPHVSSAHISAEPYGFRRAFADPVLRRSLIAGGLLLGGNGAYYAFASLYWASHGFSAGVIGGLFAFSVVAEVALFWAAKLMPGWGARRFLILAAIGALVRWSLFPFATTTAAALMLQALHALTFGAAHLGVMMAIGAVSVPGHTARLQGVHQIVSGLILAIATLAAGPIYRVSPAAVFIAMAVLAAPALYFALRLRPGLQPQSAALGGSTSAPE